MVPIRSALWSLRVTPDLQQAPQQTLRPAVRSCLALLQREFKVDLRQSCEHPSFMHSLPWGS
jgi:hypothetical protein